MSQPEYYTVLLYFHINTYSTTTTTHGKADITMDRCGGTQQRYLISGPLYCVLYNSWKWLERTVWHVFLWRVSLWKENEPITDRNDTTNTHWLSANLVLFPPNLSRSGMTERWETLRTRLTWPAIGDVSYINILTRLPKAFRAKLQNFKVLPFSVTKQRCISTERFYIPDWHMTL